MVVSDQLHRLRVDNVGSMLRPARLQTAMVRHRGGEVPDADLRRMQDEAIEELVRIQLAHDLPVVVDGEFRRSQFMESFAEVAGFEQWATRHARARQKRGLSEGRVVAPSELALTPATQRLRLVRNVPLEEYKFTQALTDRPVKVTLIGPERVLTAYDEAGSWAVYDDSEEFLEDLIAVLRTVVGGLADAGCRYVQIDAPGFTRYADPPSLRRMQAQGRDPAAAIAQAVAAENAVIRDFPGVTFGVHLCRGNEQSRWHREGTYDAIAERLFGELEHHRLLLEYDSARAGSFEALKHVRDDATVVLGLITTKVGQLEGADELCRRIDEAARFVPLERLALSPQCGFASTVEGNELTVDEQWRKLDLMMDVAARVWG